MIGPLAMYEQPNNREAIDKNSDSLEYSDSRVFLALVTNTQTYLRLAIFGEKADISYSSLENTSYPTSSHA